MKIIAVANQKGGVGKTTTAVNLSACLADASKKVLLFDSDPQGNATSGVGEQGNNANTVYDILINGMDIREVARPTQFKNLHLCKADIQLAGAEIELVSLEKREFMFKQAFENAKEDYDYIIIDCPPSLGLITINILTASNSVLIPIQCEYFALEGLGQLTATVRKVRSSLNPHLEIEGVLLTMFDTRTNLSLQVADEVKRFFPDKVYKTAIPRNVRLGEAPSFGMPVIYYDKFSKGSESYISLAKEVLKNNKSGREIGARAK